jgi:hypothetical protein
MRSFTITSLAILKVNLDQRKQDYLQSFVPLVAECIRLSKPVSDHGVISVPVLREEIQKRFGISLPDKIIELLLKRVNRSGYIIRQSKVYKPDWNKLEELDFSKTQGNVIEKYEAIIRDLMLFCRERHDINWSNEEVEAAFQQYMDYMQVDVLNAAFQHTIVPPIPENNRESLYLVASYVDYLQKTASSHFGFLETIVQGNMLANAVFLPDQQVERKFRRTTVYLDTKILVYVLGYSGEQRKQPVIELVNALHSLGAQVSCFRHTFNEIEGILYACADRIGRPQNVYGPLVETLNHFRGLGFSASDIFLLLGKIEKDLQNLRIRIEDKPPYGSESYPYLIDESKLEAYLREEIAYREESSALLCDVASISAIGRLRGGYETRYIEECKAVFVTSNALLAKATHDFLTQDSSNGLAPYCVTDTFLTTFLWLKNPRRVPDLPRKRIIADCYAAMQPSDRLWQLYLAEIEKLRIRGQLAESDYNLLIFSTTIWPILMDVTHGQEEAFTHGTIPEILEHLQTQIRAEDQKTIQEQKERADKAEEQARSEADRSTAHITHTEARAHSIARKTVTIVKTLTLLIWLALSTFLIIVASPDEQWLKVIFYLAQIANAILSMWSTYSGTPVKNLFDRLENRIFNTIKSWWLPPTFE